MAESQNNVSRVTRQMLATLALLPQVKDLDIEACATIFKRVLEKTPGYYNISMVALNGKVIASNRPFTDIYLGDRKHFIEAVKKKDFAAGEYIVTRIGQAISAFSFAYPVLNDEGDPIAVLTTVIDLAILINFYDQSFKVEKAFVSATDYRGKRLLYYPMQEATNPVGQPIKASSWEKASQAEEPGIFIGNGSDGVRRIFAFEPVRLAPGSAPYMHMWAGLPEAYILESANNRLIRNMLIMLLVAVISLFISWTLGKNAFLSPINNLIGLTGKFAAGELEARSKLPDRHNEFWILTNAFHNMARSLRTSHGALEEREKITRLILNSTAEAIYGLDRHGRCTFCNQRFLDILGYQSEQELLGCNMHELIHHSTIDRTSHPIEDCKIYEAFKSGKLVYSDSEVLWKADGTCFPADYRSHFMRENGEVVGAVVTFIDITDRKRTEKDRESLIAQLQAKSEEQERFVYTVSHDLKSPLVTIGGFLGLIEQDFAARDEVEFKANIAVIANAAQRMKQLLDELLELSRVGTRENVTGIVDLGSLVQRAIESVSGQINSAGATLHIEPDLPAIVVDEQKFLQVFENLISNAVKFSSSAKDGSIVSIGARQEGETVICHVTDNGIGIDPRYSNKVFGLFDKIDPESEGTGVGLAIVKRIIESHGGKIWIESDGPGYGASFCFSVPAAKI